MKKILDFSSYNSKINESRKEIISQDIKKSYPDFYKELIKNSKYYLNRGLDGNFGLDDFQGGEIIAFEPSGSDKKIKFHLFRPSNAIQSYEQSKGSLKDLLELDVNSINNYLSSIGFSGITLNEILERFRSKYGNMNSNVNLDRWPNPIVNRSSWRSTLSDIFMNYYSVIFDIISDFQKKEGITKREKISLDDILNLPEFKELEKIGFYSTTTPAIWKNGNIRFTHPFLKFRDVLDTITIYQGGPVRLTIDSRPALVTSAPGFTLNTKEDWTKKITWVNSYLKRKILKDKFGISSKKEQETLSSLDNEDFLMKLFEIEGEKFDNFLQEILDSSQAKEGILGSKGLIQKMIEQDPEKTARIFKEFYREKEIEDAVRDLPQKTQDEFKFALWILGDLSQLGF
jgi:hypothetical protein